MTNDSDDTGHIDHTDSSDGADETDAANQGQGATLERAVEEFLRDARQVYEEYDDDYLDPDAALWTIEGHIDSLEDALDGRDERDERDERN